MTELTKFIKHLKQSNLTPQQFKTLNGQALSGDIFGAEKGLTVRKDIREICIFHTDRGSEFKNEEIDKILEIGNIERSLSRPGKPVDNAVCESMYDIVKTEFVFDESFKDLNDLQAKLSAWVWWYNNERLHSSLGFKTPVESGDSCEIGVTDDKIANKKYQKFWKKISVHGQKVEVYN